MTCPWKNSSKREDRGSSIEDRGRRLFPAPFAILYLLSSILLISSAAAQAACDASRLEQAVSTYDFGRFNQTFALLKPCVPDGFGGKEQRVSAYRLMALSYVATDSLEQARAWVRQLLRVDSRFDPDPQADPPVFTAMVSDVKPRWYSWLWRGNAWYKWAGRSVLAAGVASLPFLLKNQTEPDLPGPPVLPDQ